MGSLALLSVGSNARGQLATGNVDDAHHFTPCIFSGHSPGSLPPDTVAVDQISCGANHTLALLRRRDGETELWGCGDGRRGQLGPSYRAAVERAGGDATSANAVFRLLDLNLRNLVTSDNQSLGGYAVRLIAAGWETSYTVLSCSGRDDVILSMGADDFGNLGTGSARSQQPQERAGASRHIVPLRSAIGASKEATLTVLTLSAGPHHVVAQICLDSATGSSETYAVGWGTARHGQLGPIKDAAGRPLPSTPKPILVLVPSPEQVTCFALGNQHTVCLRSSGTLLALGSNRKRQISALEALHDVERVGCTWNGTYALLRTGPVVATGSNTHSQLGRGGGDLEQQGMLGPVSFPFEPRPGQIVAMACGSEHVLCIVEPGETDGDARRKEVWGWGWNEHGNLGTGGTEDVDTPVKLWPRSEHDDGRVVNVWAGCGTSWILVRR